MRYFTTTTVSITSITLTTSTRYVGSAFSIRSCSRRRQRHVSVGIVSDSASTLSSGVGDVGGGCADDYEPHVVEWDINNDDGTDATNNSRFSRQVFASSNCWGHRPFLMRGAFNPNNLLLDHNNANKEENDVIGGDGDEEGSICASWPSWEDVVEIAADEDSESR